MTTIEACIIIPITFMSLLLLIWMGFLGYDRMVLSQVVSQAAIKGSQFPDKNNEELLVIVNERLNNLLEDKLIYMDQVETNVEVRQKEITVSVKGDMKVPGALFITDIYSNDLWSIHIEKSVQRINSSKFVRTINNLHEVIEDKNLLENKNTLEIEN